MRSVIGCSGVIALVVFVIGFVVSLFLSDVTWTLRLTCAGMLSAMAFTAAFLLSSRDLLGHTVTMRAVRHHLLANSDTSEEQFISLRPSDDPTLLLETRSAISHFFDVPVLKVGRDLHLLHDLRVDKLEPAFQFSVVNSVIASRATEPQPFGFSMAGLETLDDLAAAIRKILDGFGPDRQTEGETDEPT